MPTTLLIPVPEGEPAVHHIRLAHDPSAARGVPAHVTILYPFLPPEMIDDSVLTRLAALFRKTAPFSFSLARIASFDQRVLYLEPSPREPFIHLTARVSAAFDILPYEGRYEGTRPHLTLAQDSDTVTRQVIEAAVSPHLPVESEAREIWLMRRDEGEDWRLMKPFLLGT